MQSVSLWANEGGEIVFLYNGFRVQEVTIQKFWTNSLEYRFHTQPSGETAGAAVFF